MPIQIFRITHSFRLVFRLNTFEISGDACPRLLFAECCLIALVEGTELFRVAAGEGQEESDDFYGRLHVCFLGFFHQSRRQTPRFSLSPCFEVLVLGCESWRVNHSSFFNFEEFTDETAYILWALSYSAAKGIQICIFSDFLRTELFENILWMRL